MFKRLLLFTVLIAAQGYSEEITFKHVPAAAGDSQTTTREMTAAMKMEVHAGDKVTPQEQTRVTTEKRSVEILSMTDDKNAKAKFIYEKVLETPHTGNGEPVPTPVSGKTYIVEMKDGKLEVGTENGDKPGPEEIAIVSKEAESTMKPDRFSKVFDGKTLKPGDDINVPAESLGQMLDLPPGAKAEKFGMKLKSISDIGGTRCGTFECQFVFSMAQGDNMKMTMTFNGDVNVNERCWPASLDLSGPIKFKMQNGAVVVDGTGDTKIKISATYGKKAVKQ